MTDISQAADLAAREFLGPIAFPGLGIEVNPSVTFFGTNIHWYGIIIAIGFLAALLVGLRLVKACEGLTQDNILDIVIFGVPSGIIGARLYYVLFEIDQYAGRWADIFKIWEGGLAIYGGIIGAVISTVIYCKVKKVSLPKILDIGAVGLTIGQMIGRWGNFVNREAFGAAASSLIPWRMRLYTDMAKSSFADVHPTFLYESLWNLGVLVILLKATKKKKFDGQIFALYVMLYGIGRFWIEGLRTDSLYLGPVRISQVLAIVSAVAAVIFMVMMKRRQERLEEQAADLPETAEELEMEN